MRPNAYVISEIPKSIHDLLETQQKPRLYDILDRYFMEKRFVRRVGSKRSFYYPADSDHLFNPKRMDDVFINDGFNYKIETLNEQLYVVISPRPIFTSDGIITILILQKAFIQDSSVIRLFINTNCTVKHLKRLLAILAQKLL